MKSKELIKQLLELDPTGDTEVSVGNHDIWYIGREPAYYDGRLQVLIRDPERTGKCFDIVGAKYVSKGDKIVITSMGITDLLWDEPEMPVDYSDPGSERYRETDEKTRQAGRDVERRVHMDAFRRWIDKKAEQIRPGEKCERSADYHYEKLGLHYKDPVKDLPPRREKEGGFLGIGGTEYEVWPSWNERQEAMWDDTLEVYWRGGWGVKRKGEAEDEV